MGLLLHVCLEHSLMWCDVCIIPFFLSHIFAMLVSDPFLLTCKLSFCRLDGVPGFKITHAIRWKFSSFLVCVRVFVGDTHG